MLWVEDKGQGRTVYVMPVAAMSLCPRVPACRQRRLDQAFGRRRQRSMITMSIARTLTRATGWTPSNRTRDRPMNGASCPSGAEASRPSRTKSWKLSLFPGSAQSAGGERAFLGAAPDRPTQPL